MVNNQVQISVLMAVYNTNFSLVKRAVDSVLNQTYPHFEIIIIDDGSNNQCLWKLIEYVQLFEDKISFLQHKNIGQSKSINRGVQNSKGKYITILDADDEYENNHLELCLNQMENYDLIASTTKTIVENENDFFVSDKHDTTKLIHVDDCILFATLFGKKEIFEKIKFEDKYAADAHFYESATRFFTTAKLDLRTYIYYRNNPNSITAKMKQKNDALVL
ncbi:MAG: glycosyltransferase family 2 protein [Sphingobacteriales bacterium]|nr:MAG: glycosyltransferase family 2 protein [Sphingobacteriales bacterium]